MFSLTDFDVNARGSGGQTPLLKAVCKDKLSCAAFLLGQDASILLEDDQAVDYATEAENICWKSFFRLCSNLREGSSTLHIKELSNNITEMQC